MVQLVLAFGVCNYKLVFQFVLDKGFRLLLEFKFPGGTGCCYCMVIGRVSRLELDSVLLLGFMLGLRLAYCYCSGKG